VNDTDREKLKYCAPTPMFTINFAWTSLTGNQTVCMLVGVGLGEDSVPTPERTCSVLIRKEQVVHDV
jgi:hypothetical protein